jgi:enamine deaminase RidA (YjgF/YER057c/UK114 family)
MPTPEERLAALGLVLPQAMTPPPGLTLPFPWVNVRGEIAFLSGHGPQESDGAVSGPFGAVGAAVTVEEARESARKTALSMLGSLKRELGSLDRVTGWRRVHGMIQAAPGFIQTSAVMNGFSELILEVFGSEIGRHARTAVGVAGLPLNLPIEVEAEVSIRA